MKNLTVLFSTVVLLFSAFGAKAGEPFFCVTPGSTLYYERYDTDNGKLMQTTFFEIDSKVPQGNQSLVKYFVTMKKANGKPIFGGRTALEVIFGKSGETQLDFGLSVSSFIKNIFKNLTITTEGNAAVLPAVMKPGDKLQDAHCVVRAGALKLTIDVTERTVLREETITVPGGTYKCIVAREHKVEDAPFHHVDTWSDSWYAPGIGYVRHDVYNSKMKLEASEILVNKK